ncbi:MAG: enoyl-CoA hydratase/isomerase family protein [Gammaproteobacteria bacterium]|nr:enoyl-CoA hydratase/isomerase family protein [Gammaproteobacteria bacterium]
MPYDFPELGISFDGMVAVVEIQRPPHNFFDYQLIEQIADAFEALDRDDACRALVLASQGKSFCAGANFGRGPDDASADRQFGEHGFRDDTTGRLYRAAVRLFRCAKPVVGAIQGAAIGGGLGVSLVPDFRVACPETRFAANFVKLGIHPGFGISVTLPRIVGIQQASRLLLTGCRVSGEEAVKIGLADKLSSLENIRSDAVKFAAEMAENAPLAVEAVRATQRQGLADAIAEITEHELAEQQRLRATDDAVEGIRSVAERRLGNFQRR